MNRSPTSSETNDVKSTQAPVFNYAEAAKRPSGSKNGQPNSSPSKNSPQSSTPSSKNALNASVQLPRAPPSETVPIQFGSINEPADTISQRSSTKSGDFTTSVKSSELTFGSVPATDASSSPSWQPPPQPSPTQTQGSPSYHQNHGNRPYRHHHNYKQHSAPMGMAHSPQNGVPSYYVPQGYDGQRGYDQRSFQGYDGQRQYYAHYSGMPAMSYGGMGMPQAGNHSSPQAYVPPARSSKAIRIIDPVTKAEVKADALASASSASNSKDNAPKSDDKKEKEHKPTGSPSPVSKAIPIVDPAIKQREERERQEREEAERKAKEEAERKAKEEEEQRKAKEEEERKAKEEAERKAKEEEERKAKEEAERIAKEEAERKAEEEAEKAKVEEEARKKAEEEQRQREEREKQEREEAERKAKEEADKAKAQEEEAEKSRKAQEEASKPVEEPAKEEPKLQVKTDIKPEEKSEAKSEEKENKPPATPVRTIDDPSTIKYPPEVKAPFGSKDPVTGKIQYDPAFLMQFAPLCLETTEDLSEFRSISEEAERAGRPGMARRQTSERGRGARTPSSPMGMGMFKHGSRDGRMEMGKFAGGRPLGPRSGSGSHGLPPAGGAPGSPGGMQREGSHGGRSRSGRGGKGRHPPKDQDKERQQQGGPTIPPEQVAPLEKSENRWIPLALRKQREEAQNDDGLLSDEIIMRKVKSLLNKLTWEKFDSISNQIWEYAKQSEKEKDGRALKIVIQLTFEKACDEAPFAALWAQLCRKMYDSITDDIKDENILDAKGEPVAGVNLFRKYLLNRCQHDFERGWKSQIPKVENQEMLSDEYYAAVKAKRQGLGLVQFIGELFKRHMLTDRIMLSCLTRLCADPLECEDEETETMCKLVTTIGRDLDTSSRKNKEWLDTYFERMKEMKNSPNLSNRVKFMIDDVFDLRRDKWVPRRGNQPAPTTIAEVHEQAQKAKEAEAAALKRTTSSRGSLPPPPKVETRPDGWSTVGSSSPGSATPKKDLSNFGKTDRSKTRSGVLGPSGSPFASLARAGAKDKDEEDSNASGGSTNMFSALNDE